MTTYRFGPFRLEKEPMLLWAHEHELPLGPKVVETLLALVENPGEVHGKAELLERIWPEGFVDEANLAQNVYVIRKALREHWPADCIQTVPRRGYRFSGSVSLVESAPATPQRRAGVVARRAACAAVIALAVLGVGLGTIQAAHPPAASAKLSPAGARLYAIGNYYWNQRTRTSILKSIRYFTAVTQSDPRDARGYAGLASAFAIEADYGYGSQPKRDEFARASAYAGRALTLDPRSAPALAVQGLTQMEAGRVRAGALEFQRAIAADPRYAPAHQWYGMSLLNAGQGVQAYHELQRAADLDPESVAATDWLSEAAYMDRRYREARDYARQTLDLSPQRYDAYNTLGMAYEALGDYASAISAYTTFGRSCTQCRGEAAALLAHAYAVMHNDAAAQAQLSMAQQALATQPVDPEDVVTALVAMGRRTEALHVLKHDSNQLVRGALAIDPRMDPVRGDARFQPYMQSPG